MTQAKNKITNYPTPRHPDPMVNRKPSSVACAVDLCDRAHYSLGWCRSHYERYSKHGGVFADVPIGRGVRFRPVGYNQAHQRVRDVRGLASDQVCADCGGPAIDWCYDHGDPDELTDTAHGSPYSLDVTHYVARCKSCHRTADHRNRLVRGGAPCR